MRAGKRDTASINPNFVETVDNIHNVVMIVQDTIGDRSAKVIPSLLFYESGQECS